jgi:hypothetical protein
MQRYEVYLILANFDGTFFEKNNLFFTPVFVLFGYLLIINVFCGGAPCSRIY